MATARRRYTPKLRKHSTRDQGYVELNGKRFYLGPVDAPTTREKYHRLIAEWEANGRSVPVEPEAITVSVVVDRYLRHARSYYRKNGEPTTQVGIIELVSNIRPQRRAQDQTRSALLDGVGACRAVSRSRTPGLCSDSW